MGGVYGHENLLPIRVVEAASDKDAVPLVENARVKVELTTGELEHVVSGTLAHGQKYIGQGRTESELNVVTLLAARVHSDERVFVERHSCYLGLFSNCYQRGRLV